MANRADKKHEKKSAQKLLAPYPRYGNRGKPNSLSGRFRCGHGQLCGQGMDKAKYVMPVPCPQSCPHPSRTSTKFITVYHSFHSSAASKTTT